MRQQRQQSNVLSIFYEKVDQPRYALNAKLSFKHPLPRKEIDLGYMKLEVFGLPGYEKEQGKYLLSQTGVAIAIGEDEISARRYFRAINPEWFKVEGSKRPIRGIPLQVAAAYWLEALSQGNKKAFALVLALAQTGLEHHADLQFDVTREDEEKRARLVELVERAAAD